MLMASSLPNALTWSPSGNSLVAWRSTERYPQYWPPMMNRPLPDGWTPSGWQGGSVVGGTVGATPWHANVLPGVGVASVIFAPSVMPHGMSYEPTITRRWRGAAFERMNG